MHGKRQHRHRGRRAASRGGAGDFSANWPRMAVHGRCCQTRISTTTPPRSTRESMPTHTTRRTHPRRALVPPSQRSAARNGTTTERHTLPKHRPTGHAKQITAQQEPGQPGSRSSTPGRRRADRRSAARRWPPSAAEQVLRRMPAASALRAENLVGDRRAEQGGTPLRGPARLVEQPVWHCTRHPSRDLSEGLRLGAHAGRHAH